jgi:CheY-like chemotaxis protein
MNVATPYVLMLEDDSDDRFVTQSFFTEQDYNVGLHFVEESLDVLPHLQQCVALGTPLPGLIILDKNTPAKNGLDVLREIKAHKIFQQIPVVIVSGSAFPGEVDNAYRLGASSYITKPTSHEATFRKIDMCIRYWFEVVDLPEPLLASA